jgi:hypothetical protein
MEMCPGCEDWPAVAIVPGMVDVLDVQAGEDPTSYVRIVITLDNILPAHHSAHHRQVETLFPQCKIALVVGGYSI